MEVEPSGFNPTMEIPGTLRPSERNLCKGTHLLGKRHTDIAPLEGKRGTKLELQERGRVATRRQHEEAGSARGSSPRKGHPSHIPATSGAALPWARASAGKGDAGFNGQLCRTETSE